MLTHSYGLCWLSVKICLIKNILQKKNETFMFSGPIHPWRPNHPLRCDLSVSVIILMNHKNQSLSLIFQIWEMLFLWNLLQLCIIFSPFYLMQETYNYYLQRHILFIVELSLSFFCYYYYYQGIMWKCMFFFFVLFSALKKVSYTISLCIVISKASVVWSNCRKHVRPKI